MAMNDFLGQPPLMLVDLRPVGSPMIIVKSHEVAEQVAKSTKAFPQSLPKTPAVYGHMEHVICPSSILSADASNGIHIEVAAILTGQI
jgi:hypothetical protein